MEPIQAKLKNREETLVMRGCLIPEGETAVAILASVNRDTGLWDGRVCFDIHRLRLDCQSFGEGAHGCLGHHFYTVLAANIVLPKLLEQVPALRLVDRSGVKFMGVAFRGPSSASKANRREVITPRRKRKAPDGGEVLNVLERAMKPLLH